MNKIDVVQYDYSSRWSKTTEECNICIEKEKEDIIMDHFMESIREVVTGAVENWISGSVTREQSMEIHQHLKDIIDEAETRSQGSQVITRLDYYQFVRIAEVAELWCELLRKGLKNVMSPYEKGNVLYLTLRLMSMHGVSIELAEEIIIKGLGVCRTHLQVNCNLC